MNKLKRFYYKLRGYKEGFKVVTELSGDSYWSFMAPFLNKWAREYVPGKKTLRDYRCGPLAVFPSFAKAEMFRTDNSLCADDTVVWPCLYKPSVDSGLWYPLHTDRPVVNTIFADSVIILDLSLAENIAFIKRVT